MSPLMKCFLGIFAVFCFMQFVEMARVPRDEAAAASADKVDFSKALDDIVSKLKGALENENVQKFIAQASTTFNEGTEQLQKTMQNIGTQIGDALKDKTPAHP